MKAYYSAVVATILVCFQSGQAKAHCAQVEINKSFEATLKLQIDFGHSYYNEGHWEAAYRNGDTQKNAFGYEFWNEYSSPIVTTPMKGGEESETTKFIPAGTRVAVKYVGVDGSHRISGRFTAQSYHAYTFQVNDREFKFRCHESACRKDLRSFFENSCTAPPPSSF